MASKETFIGLSSAFIGLGLLVAFLNIGNHAPMVQWPVEAYWAMAFTAGWLTRTPDWLAMLLAFLLFVMVAIISYVLGAGAYRKLTR